MKILHLLSDDETALATAQNLIEGLQTSSLEQRVITPTAHARFGPLCLDLPGPRLLPKLQKSRLRRLIAREKPDLIHCWTTRAAALLGPTPPRPAIGWINDYQDPAAYKNCTLLVGSTPDITKHLLSRGASPDRTRCIPTFLEIPALPPLDRACLTTPRDAKVLLVLSRLQANKGIETLLAALKDLPGIYLWLAGEGPTRRDLEIYADNLGLTDRVRFLGGREDAAALLRATTVCVQPARAEPSPAAILYSWAAGTPIVACANPSATGLIEDDLTGLLTPIDDPAALATALRRALYDEELRRRLIAQGYAAYIKDHTREGVTRRWIELYRAALATESRLAVEAQKAKPS